jgi:LPPG:FO 2-phospho-L-lactate transferase
VICLLAGGVGGARMARALYKVVGAHLSVVVNVGDDFVHQGLYVSPDIDTVTYTLAGLNDEERGWGIAGDTYVVHRRLAELGGPSWFLLGDRDLATHLYRTGRLAEGATLCAVADEIREALGVVARIHPASDAPLRTKLCLKDGRILEFQEYFVKERAEPPVERVLFEPPAVEPCHRAYEAILQAETIVIAPSNPYLSVAPILACGLRDSVASRRSRVVAVCPIVGGRALKGPLSHLMAELGARPDCVGVASFYSDLAAYFVVDEVDSALVPDIEALGLSAIVMPTLLTDTQAALALAERICSL